MTEPKFVPTIYYENGTTMYGVLLVDLKRCCTCARPMIRLPTRGHPTPLPRWHENRVERQLRAASWGIEAAVTDTDNRAMCTDCALKHSVTFKCCMCEKEHEIAALYRSFGYKPFADYLCCSCYATVPAQKWDRKVSGLEEEHRYDE